VITSLTVCPQAHGSNSPTVGTPTLFLVAANNGAAHSHHQAFPEPHVTSGRWHHRLQQQQLGSSDQKRSGGASKGFSVIFLPEPQRQFRRSQIKSQGKTDLLVE
jgi:hypothetical protein